MKTISRQLSVACCSLLGLSNTSLAQSEPWLVELGVMNFNEQDRNTGLEFIANARRETEDGGNISIGADIDVITGATPNGATTSNTPQTFTMSSGVGSYTVDANELPADDTHMDTRLDLHVERDTPLSQDLNATYNGLISMEFDYLSFSAGGSLAWDFNKKNTTLITAINLEYNRVHPVGSIPVPLASMQAAGLHQPRDVAADSKIGEEFSIGINQILDRNSLAQVRLTSSHFRGYLNDPYKFLSVVDDQNGASLGHTVDYVYENRPDTRLMNSIYLAYRRNFDRGILDLAYRLYRDSWQVHSNTLDLAFRLDLANRYFVRPSIRLYQQDKAEFYRHSLTSSENLPEYASADFRLANFNARTLGIEIGKTYPDQGKQGLALEYYTQWGDSHPTGSVGLQQSQDLYPSLKTLIVKYSYTYQWK
jgi:hypothetical protein